MKKLTTVDTTIVVELSAQDILDYADHMKVVPADWKFYSLELVGKGISDGGKLIIRHSANHHETK